MKIQEKPFSDLSIISQSAKTGGHLLDIIKDRFENLEDTGREIFRKVYTCGFLSLKSKMVNYADRTLVEIDPLFINSLVRIESSQDLHFLTPFSPLSQLVVKSASEEFGLKRMVSEFHYDVNHSIASRLVNEIENFFRDQLRQIINSAPLEASSQKIDAFLKIFSSKKGFEDQISNFINDTGVLAENEREKLANAFKDAGVFSDDEKSTYLTCASRIKQRSKAQDDFVAEQLDLIYFLDSYQLQHVFSVFGKKQIKKAMHDNSFMPSWEIKALFEKFTLLRNDVSHNRPVSQKRIESLHDEYQSLKAKIGKENSKLE